MVSKRSLGADKTLTKVVASDASDASKNPDKMGDLDATDGSTPRA
jgi:hypothetical protein